MENVNIYNIIKNFNNSTFRRDVIPMGFVPGWPALTLINDNKTLMLTVPYYRRQREKNRAAIYPIYCSVSFPINNPSHLMDYTLYPLHSEWKDVDFKTPAGYFDMGSGNGFLGPDDYKQKCIKLYEMYDHLCVAIQKEISNQNEENIGMLIDNMSELMRKMIEPGLIPYYFKINKTFFNRFIR